VYIFGQLNRDVVGVWGSVPEWRQTPNMLCLRISSLLKDVGIFVMF